MIEQAGEFDFAIADLGDAGERVLEIALQFAANGIKLQADGFDGAVSGRPTHARRDQRGETGAEGRFKKAAAIHGKSSLCLCRTAGRKGGQEKPHSTPARTVCESRCYEIGPGRRGLICRGALQRVPTLSAYCSE